MFCRSLFVLLLFFFRPLYYLSFDLRLLIILLGLCLWCLASRSTIHVLHLYRGGQFHWWRKQEYPMKTTDLPQVTDKRYHIILHRVHFVTSRFRTYNLLVLLVLKSIVHYKHLCYTYADFFFLCLFVVLTIGCYKQSWYIILFGFTIAYELIV